MNTETREKKSNSQVSSERSEEEGHGGDTVGAAMVVAGRLPSRGYDGEGRHHAHDQEAKHNTWEATSGLQAAVQPTRP
jgi:hypothetical protein